VKSSRISYTAVGWGVYTVMLRIGKINGSHCRVPGGGGIVTHKELPARI